MSDLYRNFGELKSKESPNSYRIVARNRSSPVTFIAPHGGNIEPGTSEIVRALADKTYNLYLFEGIRPRSRELHITSHHFDEPQCLKLVGKSEIVIAVHGRANESDMETICLGGLDQRRINSIASSLATSDFHSQTEGHKFSAKIPNNICNRGVRGEGVQLRVISLLKNGIETKSGENGSVWRGDLQGNLKLIQRYAQRTHTRREFP